MEFIKYRTKTWIQNTPGLIERAKEDNLVTCFFVFRNTGNLPLTISSKGSSRLMDLNDEFNTSMPFFSIDDTSYELGFSTNTRSNCVDAKVAEVTVTRYDIIK